MILPVPGSPPGKPTSDSRSELAAAMRLLSGKDCKRDATSAQVMLVRLAEGDSKDLAEDANHILRAGAARDWFGEATPQHFELERLATRSAGANTSTKSRQVMMLIFGLVAFFVGTGVYMMMQTGETEAMPVLIVAALILGVGLAFAFKRSEQS